MGDRRFTDKDGMPWDVRVPRKSEWVFEQVDDNPGPARTGAPPRYEADPFELSAEELQRALDAAKPPRQRPKSSPFLD